MQSGTAFLIAAFGMIIGLAMISVLVSQKAQTSSILQAFASGGSTLIGAAVAPVTQSSNGLGG
jgi:hypothetical protein